MGHSDKWNKYCYLKYFQKFTLLKEGSISFNKKKILFKRSTCSQDGMWLCAYLICLQKLKKINFLFLFYLLFSFCFMKKRRNNGEAVKMVSSLRNEFHLNNGLNTIPNSIYSCQISRIVFSFFFPFLFFSLFFCFKNYFLLRTKQLFLTFFELKEGKKLAHLRVFFFMLTLSFQFNSFYIRN